MTGWEPRRRVAAPRTARCKGEGWAGQGGRRRRPHDDGVAARHGKGYQWPTDRAFGRTGGPWGWRGALAGVNAFHDPGRAGSELEFPQVQDPHAAHGQTHTS